MTVLFIGPEGWRGCRDTYRLFVRLEREDDGGFSAVLSDLPGVASQGDTEEEALENVAEAFRAAFASYRDVGTPIPWQHNDGLLPRAGEKVIVVDCSRE